MSWALDIAERECCMTLDEMSITAGVQYDNRNDNFLGGVTLPGHSGTDTHVLVFMLGGITTRCKQTIAHYYTGNSTDGRVFADIVIQIIRMCHEIGLNVAAVTSDMGSPNRAMWKKLGIVIGSGIAAKNSFPHPCNHIPAILKTMFAFLLMFHILSKMCGTTLSVDKILFCRNILCKDFSYLLPQFQLRQLID